jgi:hypothetical protein
MAENMVPLPVRVPKQLKEKVADYAEENGLSNSEMGRQLLARGLEVERDGKEPERLEAELEAARRRVEDLEEENDRLRGERENLAQRLEYTPPRDQLKSGAAWFLIIGFALSLVATSTLFESLAYSWVVIDLATTAFTFSFFAAIAWAVAVIARRVFARSWFNERSLWLQKTRAFQVAFDLPAAEELERIHKPDSGGA